ncbi:hypothetical protein SDC9_37643 [bioreactor metagenome]|uniref:Uncharacterized protein n=1 Tax=bioreactor metagenome TaxID=1076179 RepID=A0A644VJP9_9ZZZZ
MADADGEHREEGKAGQPPDVPHHREAEGEGEGRQQNAGCGVLRHVDRRIAVRPGEAFLLHPPELVTAAHMEFLREIVGRGRRLHRPFERAAVPRVGPAGEFLAVQDRVAEVREGADDAAQDQQRAEGRDDEVGLPGGIGIGVHPPRHAHQAKRVKRHEGEPEADEPEPEGRLAEPVVELEAEGLGPPVADRGIDREDHAADDHVVEVRDQEQRVVELEVDRRNRQQDAGHAADGEGHEEADRPQHRHFEPDLALVHGEQPVEDLHPRRHRDDHRGDAEEGVDVRARAHGEEVVQPDDEAQHHDTGGRIDHRLVAEQRLAREGRDDLREDAEAGDDQDVDFRVAPDPDQVDVHHRIATKVIGEEMHAEIAVEGQQRERGGQHREGRDDQHVGAQRRPGEDRHVHQLHPRCAHLQDGGDQVDAGERRAHARDLQRPQVIVHAWPGRIGGARERREGQPANAPELADEKRDVHEERPRHCHPEREVVQEREGHVARADLRRHHIVHDPGHEGHGDEEDHDHAMRGEDLVEVVRRQIARCAARGHRLLRAHHQRIGKAAHHHDEAEHHVHDADLLVVDRGDPVAPQRHPQPEIGHQRQDGEAAERDAREGADQDRFVIGDPVEGQAPEDRGDHLAGVCNFS